MSVWYNTTCYTTSSKRGGKNLKFVVTDWIKYPMLQKEYFNTSFSIRHGLVYYSNFALK